MSGRYILDGRNAVPCENLMEWGEWMQRAERRVHLDIIGTARVSTVFLGLDHQYGDGPPLLFETMVFGGRGDEEMERYSTWEEAEAGHKAMVERIAGRAQ